MSDYPDRIPFEAWRNSQLSIARHYGGCTLNGKSYIIEPGTNDLVAKPAPKIKPRTKPIK